MDITADEFTAKMNSFEENLNKVFAEGRTLETEISNNLRALKYE
jgi:type I restriction enzyme M protein